jgi:hypothetical protein
MHCCKFVIEALTMSGFVIKTCDSKMSFKLELDKISSPIIESPIFKSKFEIGISKAGLTASLIAHFKADDLQISQ